MSEEFNELLEKYSEYLTDTSNKDGLLAFGRRIFGAGSSDINNRESAILLKQKINELSEVPEKSEIRQKMQTSRSFFIRTEANKNYTQEMINEEILSLQKQIEELREKRRRLTEFRDVQQKRYAEVIEESMKTKKDLQERMKELKRELQASLLRDRPKEIPADTASIRPVMEELAEMNSQILQKIANFREMAADAHNHCERAILDRYKPIMEETLQKVYQDAENIPIDDLIERFNHAADETELKVSQMMEEMNTENTRNERLQTEARAVEDRVFVQREEVNRLKKQHLQIGQEIANLNDIATKEISALKAEYARLLTEPEEEQPVPLSSRAIVVTDKGQKRSLKKSPSNQKVDTHSIKNPETPSIEQFIEMERKSLLSRIQGESQE